MFQDAFEKLEPSEVQTILDQINPLLEGTKFDAAETTILALDIPFYPGYRIMDIADHTVMPVNRRFAVMGPEKTTVLNYTNEPIYTLNKNAPVKLSEKNIEDYVRFFFSYVRGKHGRFVIVENVDDINWREDPPPAARKAIGKMITPITLKDVDDSGAYHMECTMVFKDSLFRSDVTIQKNGGVNLSNEELLIEDMPVLDDTFGQ